MWASRFCKTRSLARTLIQSGKVSYNGQPCKPGKIVELGAVIKFPAGYDHKEVVVKELSDKKNWNMKEFFKSNYIASKDVNAWLGLAEVIK